MRRAVLLLIAAAAFSKPLPAEEQLLPQRVVYVGNQGTARAEAFKSFLSRHFAEVTTYDRGSFEPSSAAKADVVLLDWSQSDTDSAHAKSPLGPRHQWSTPTVLLGSAGHLLAAAWEIIGGSG